MVIKLENFFLALLGILARIVFILYRLLIILLILTLLFSWPVYWFYGHTTLNLNWFYPLLIVAIVLLFATTKPAPPKDNPYRKYVGTGSFLNARIDEFIAWIGTLKYFTSPIVLVEDPGSYKIKGVEIRELIDGKLQPGDILLRGYDGYIDGVMIRHSGGAEGIGVYFSHAALYLGELVDADKSIAARRLEIQDESGLWIEASEDDKEKVRNDPNYFQTGRQMVVHAMTKGVFIEDILTFLRCDYLIVLRLHDTIELDPSELIEDKSLIMELPSDAEGIRLKLMNGESVNKDEIIEAVRRSALGKIGSCYDFQFNDTKDYHRFSCSEFVYYCFKSIQCYLGLKLKMRGFLNLFFRRETITPSDIYEAAYIQNKLEIVWQSNSLQEKNNP
jgi:hypothetical protein